MLFSVCHIVEKLQLKNGHRELSLFVVNQTLNISLSPFYIILSLIKNVVKATDKNGEGFFYLKGILFQIK